VKITKVAYNNRRKSFAVKTRRGEYEYPYARLDQPMDDLVREVYVDRELGGEAFTYVLESGSEGTVHIDSVLDYNSDPMYVADLILYKLTLEAQKHVDESTISRNELMRRLKTSPSQFARLLDQTNYRKSFRQLVALLALLDCEVEVEVK
jgi:hypothetical protein